MEQGGPSHFQAEFPEVVELAIICHDLGNILDKVVVDEKGIYPIFLDFYKTKNAEKKAASFAQSLIFFHIGDEKKAKRYVPLVKHLIKETTFIGNENEPFSTFMRVVDQIGNGLFNKKEKEEYVRGLLEENIAEDENFKVNPYFYMNFVEIRFPQLVEDEEKRSKILDIWEKEIPEYLPFTNENTPATELLEKLKEKQG